MRSIKQAATKKKKEEPPGTFFGYVKKKKKPLTKVVLRGKKKKSVETKVTSHASVYALKPSTGHFFFCFSPCPKGIMLCIKTKKKTPHVVSTGSS
jgi:hypothetical protein